MPQTPIVVRGVYDFHLVWLSILIAISAAYCALELASRTAEAEGKTRIAWLLGGASTLGIGIWSMHYVGMLALKLPIPVSYNLPTVLLSLLVAVLTSILGFLLLGCERTRIWRFVSASFLLGAGIAAAHYIGMAAMRLSAICHYNLRIVAASVGIAIVASAAAILLCIHCRKIGKEHHVAKFMSGVLMGLAVAVMHYAGMASVTFYASPSPVDMTHSVNVTPLGIAGITVVILIVLGVAAATSHFNRRFAAQARLLTASEHRFRTLSACSPVGIFETDSQGACTYTNETWHKISGQSAEECLGLGWAKAVYPDDRERLIEHATSSTKNKIPWRMEHRILRPDGTVRWIRAQAAPLRSDTGEAIGFVGTADDVTAEKESEEQLKAAKEVAEAASRAKSDFLAAMSHEIRTPMNGVLGMANLLLETTLTSEQQDYLHLLTTSAESLLNIINDILDFSKIEAGKITIEPIPFDLRRVVEDISELFLQRCIDKRLDLLVRFAPDAPNRVIGDPGRIRQILVNLIGNALKFTAQGHIYVNAVYGKPGDQPGFYRFSIEDTGIGIPEEKITRIFERFTQADASTTRKFGGTGLGLSISKRLVELMGGEIGVSSRAGEGSTFWFTLPLPLDPTAPVDVSRAIDLSKVRILIVDDLLANRFVVSEILSRQRLRHDAVASADAALAAVREAVEAGDPYCFAILDQQMPVVDGETLAQQIKADLRLRDTILIMSTSCGQRGDAERMRDAGFAAYFTKPTRGEDLLEAIATLWAARKENRALPLVTRHFLAEARGAVQHAPAPESGSSRAHLLLVEDNTINQKLAIRLLERLGCHVDLAENGQQAIEIIERSVYDAILMDCQMPVMDGFDATREIRRRENGNPRRVIIAMTANAMSGDRERCLEAGMDDYISKPITKGELIQVLRRQIPSWGDTANLATNDRLSVLS